MKVKDEANCKVKFRNLPDDDHFHFRVEYKKPMISLYYYDFVTEEYQSCTSIENEMDFNGIFMLTGNAGNNNPDHIYVDSFAMYDPSEEVSAAHNQHFHDAH